MVNEITSKETLVVSLMSIFFRPLTCVYNLSRNLCLSTVHLTKNYQASKKKNPPTRMHLFTVFDTILDMCSVEGYVEQRETPFLLLYRHIVVIHHTCLLKCKVVVEHWKITDYVLTLRTLSYASNCTDGNTKPRYIYFTIISLSDF